MSNTREIRDAAEKAENKAKEAAAKKEFEKAADYFTFAADAYLRIAKNLKDEATIGKCKVRAGKLEQLSKQCRAAARREESKPEPEAAPEAEEEDVEESVEESEEESMEEEDELSLENDSEDETVEVDIPGEEDEEPEEETGLSLTDEVVSEEEIADEEPEEFDEEEELEEDEDVEVDAPPVAPPPPKAGVKIPKTKKLKRGPLPGKGPVKPPRGKKRKKGSSQLVAPPGRRKESKVVTAPKPAVVAAPKPVEAPAPVAADDPEEAILEEAPDVVEEPDMQGAPVLGKKDSERGRAIASDGDLEELADSAGARPASVVISLDAEDFPEQVLKPNEFSIELSPRFTEHICKALTMGDVSQIATKFNKLADNLIRKAMGGDPRDELDLRFTALACREVADRLTAAPPGDPTGEIDKARRAYQRGDRKVAAELYKKAALALLGVQDDSEEKTSKHERQASEYLSFSSRLRQVGH